MSWDYDYDCELAYLTELEYKRKAHIKRMKVLGWVLVGIVAVVATIGVIQANNRGVAYWDAIKADQSRIGTAIITWDGDNIRGIK